MITLPQASRALKKFVRVPITNNEHLVGNVVINSTHSFVPKSHLFHN